MNQPVPNFSTALCMEPSWLAMAPVHFSAQIQDAMCVAVEAHGHQRRKDGSPFLLHPLAVWRELLQADVASLDLQLAALLHDVLEERPEAYHAFLAQIESRFGSSVAEIVLALTDDRRLSRQERKAAQLTKLAHAPLEVRVLKLADRCANLVAPPPQWSVEQIRFYAMHSYQLLRVLRGSHPALEKRVLILLDQASWNHSLTVFQ